MSDISERIMRGAYVSKSECFEHAEEIERTMSVYQKAMRAMAEHDENMQHCECEYDGDARDDGTPYVYRIPNPICPVHAQEDAE
jgi:hypothetical protein